jgi:hypothetical protein
MPLRAIAAGVILTAFLAAFPAVPAESNPSRPTAAEQKGLERLVAHVLEKDFKLVPIRTAPGSWRVGLAVRGYHKHETESGVAADPFWNTGWAEELGSWKDLRVSVSVGDGFCGGEGRSFLVTISSRKSSAPVKQYGVFAGEALAKLDYMDGDSCME